MKNNKKLMAGFLSAAMILSLAVSTGVSAEQYSYDDEEYANTIVITLNEGTAFYDGVQAEEFDYTWHCDPSVSHNEVKDAPAEFYTGTKPETDAPVYIDHELYYYPLLSEENFKLINYDGEQEWAYYYTDGEHDDYIFSTLPCFTKERLLEMMHSEEEAAENKVLHITQPGTYMLQGEWKGQIRVDLGDEEDVFANPEAKVTLILNGVTVECSVAPGIIFNSVYECDNTWEEREKSTQEVDTEEAGATVILADDSENTITGTNIFRMLKTKYKDEDAADEIKLQKKMRKLDGALYSYMSMNINGETEGTGTLIVNSEFEGINSELHLTIKGGNITVNSQDDCINVNEDHVSVFGLCGGNVILNAAAGTEGDGIDSNGYIVVDGGTVAVNGVVVPDSALDSEDGIYYQAGTIVIDGEEQKYETGTMFRETGRMGGAPGDMGDFPNRMKQPEMNGVQPGTAGDAKFGEVNAGFGQNMEHFQPEFSDENFDMKEFKEKVAALPDDATLQDVFEALK